MSLPSPQPVPSAPSADPFAADRREVGNALAAHARARRADTRRLGGAMALALLIHAALLGAFAWTSSYDRMHRIGTAGQQLDAISVEIALESGIGADNKPLSGSTDAGRVAAPEASPVTTGSIAKPEVDRDTPPVVVARPDPSPQTDAPVLPIAEARKLEPIKEQERSKEPEKPALPEAPKQQAATSAPPSGEAIPAPAKSAPSRGATRPSDGQMQAYGRTVSQALQKTPPKPIRGVTGTVHVIFRIAEGGGFAFVRVLKSSGRPDLDEATIASVRRVKVPAPPAGMTDDERTYSIGYSF